MRGRRTRDLELQFQWRNQQFSRVLIDRACERDKRTARQPTPTHANPSAFLTPATAKTSVVTITMGSRRRAGRGTRYGCPRNADPKKGSTVMFPANRPARSAENATTTL
jgi:hypothetical protein